MARNQGFKGVRWIVLGAALVVVALVVYLRLQPKAFEALSPRRGEIRASFSEPARTRLDKTYLITMPVAGRIARIKLEPGDDVTVAQTLAAYDMVPLARAVEEAESAVRELKASLDVKRDDRIEKTGLQQSRLSVDAAKDAVRAAEEQIKADKARADRAAKQLKRMETLARTRAISETVLDDARLEAETTTIALRQKQFDHATTKTLYVITELMPKIIQQYMLRKDLEEAVLTHQLAQAQARLAQAVHDRDLAKLVSPINGKVLERYEQGDGSLPVGQKLLLLGDLDRLEVIADVLTEDALKIHVGSTVELGPVPGVGTIGGKVKRIEPYGFTKLSSLGVEQQRVNVIVAFEKETDRKPKGETEALFDEKDDEKSEEKWRKLGVGYRLQARFLTGAKKDTLILPRYAVMQSPEGDHYVFTISAGVLKKQPVKIGLKSDLDLEITEGVTEEDLIIAHPDATMEEGVRAKGKTK